MLVGAVVLAACSGPPAAPDRPSPVPDPAADGVVRLLFLGNSHTAHHDVPGTVAALLRAARPGVRVVAVREPTIQHLQERATHRPTLALLASRPWDYVVLQAQDYSLSGRTRYPTDGAESLARRARRQGAHVVLFAEWARRDVDETRLILDTYGHIAAAGPACLPPVPEAFDRAAPLHLELLAPDGNHSSPAGALLASAVLAGALLHQPLADLPAVRTGVPARVQHRLRTVADAALAALPADRRCPQVSP
ncbi:hypothetical protein GCM10009815_22300 [Nocardioides marmoribigeumensis]